MCLAEPARFRPTNALILYVTLTVVHVQGDISSINLSRSLVTQVQGKMLEFDFRNGPLRRKYDGLKYAMKNIEDISFELSLQSDALSSDDSVCGAEEPSAKRSRGSDDGVPMAECTIADTAPQAEASFLNAAEMDEIRARMDNYDKMRELVIKDSRDVQKLAKQSIFCVMRDQLAEARTKLDQAEKCARKILETVTLVRGALANYYYFDF